MFIQSQVPEHAELHLLLSMATPLGWLERVPTYKDQQEKLADRDLATYGFLGYPLLQAADVLIYRASLVPVGEDQVPHVEMMREIARRFNHLYGKEKGFEEKAQEAVKKLGGKRAKHLQRTAHRASRSRASMRRWSRRKAMLDEAQSLSHDRPRAPVRLSGRQPQADPGRAAGALTEASRLPGLDGQKMSKSYGNAIALREDQESVIKKIRTMPTDPARVRRTDPGEPEKCPVWQLHRCIRTTAPRTGCMKGCTIGGIGCLECKQPVIDAILKEQEPMRERAQQYLDDPSLVRAIVADGCDKARELAQETMRDVREAMGLSYS